MNVSRDRDSGQAARRSYRWWSPPRHFHDSTECGRLDARGIGVSCRGPGAFEIGRSTRSTSAAPSQTWRTFLTNHATDLVAADFFVVPTAMCRVLFVFVVLAHHRRRPVHVAVTTHPTAAVDGGSYTWRPWPVTRQSRVSTVLRECVERPSADWPDSSSACDHAPPAVRGDAPCVDDSSRSTRGGSLADARR